MVTVKTKTGDIAMFTMSVPMLVKSIEAAVAMMNSNMSVFLQVLGSKTAR